MSHRADSWEEGYDLVKGDAGASLMSPPLTKTELAAYRKELRDKDAKRKPVGFAPWPVDSPTPLKGSVKRSKATKGQKGSSTRQGQRRPLERQRGVH